MTYFYSPSTGGFYLEGLHTVIPEDKIALEISEYHALLEGLNQGQVIQVIDDVPTLVTPALPTITWTQIRNQRDVLLSACDWTQMPDVPMTDEKKQEWLAYRQALRDITEAFANPEDVVWPTMPE